MNYLGAVSKMTSLSQFISKTNYSVIQVYAPIMNAIEAEVEWLYEDIQDLLELSSRKIHFSG